MRTTKSGGTFKRILAMAAATATSAALAGICTAAPAYAEGAQLPSANASCMGFLGDASNPNASGDHIALIAQNGDASTLAQASPSGTGFPGLISCVEQIP
jgi:transcription elongation factor